MIRVKHIRLGREIMGRKQIGKRQRCRLRRMGRTFANELVRKRRQKGA